jgi:hypothetical protein
MQNDINYFKQAYARMWDSKNPLTSAIRQISNWNNSFLYGYNDWYIPSITELNYMYSNLNDLNASLAVEGDQILAGNEYWSSTSVSRLRNWSNDDPLNKDYYILEPIDPQLEPYLSSTRLTSTNFNGTVLTNDENSLTEDQAYKFTMAVSNGQKMLTQVFNGPANEVGAMRSQNRNARIAHLRPVRRIPLIVTCKNFYYSTNILQNYYRAGSSGDNFGCASCLDRVERICTQPRNANFYAVGNIPGETTVIPFNA